MACCSEPKSGSKGGCCGGGSQSFPWFSACFDPTIRRLFFRQYWRELLVGLGTGCLTGMAILAFGESLGSLGLLLHGSWLHFHAGAVLPTTILAGLILALALSRNGSGNRLAASGWVLGLAALGGLGNGFLETAGGTLAGFVQEGGWVSPLAFAGLVLPATWLVRACLAFAFKGPKRAGDCQSA